MELKGSFPRSQNPTTGPHLEANELSPHSISLRSILMLYLDLCLGLPNYLSLFLNQYIVRVSRPHLCYMEGQSRPHGFESPNNIWLIDAEGNTNFNHNITPPLSEPRFYPVTANGLIITY